jgi:tRNA wybutosine-synthesizing protein 3
MSFPYFITRKKNSQWYESSSDLSLKGEIDEAALPVLNIINSHPNYLSTSSCSGRIVFWADESYLETSNRSYNSISSLDNDTDNHSTHRSSAKACSGKWLMVSHDKLEENWKHQLESSFASIAQYDSQSFNEQHLKGASVLYLKMEPFILHIEACNSEYGQALLQLALQSGYRNSGLTVTKKRCIVAVRSTLKIDAPIALLKGNNLSWIVSEDYLKVLRVIANDKMKVNEEQHQRLLKTLEQSLSNVVPPSSKLCRGSLSKKEEKSPLLSKEKKTENSHSNMLDLLGEDENFCFDHAF